MSNRTSKKQPASKAKPKAKAKAKVNDASSKFIIPYINKPYRRATHTRAYWENLGRLAGAGVAGYFNPALAPMASSAGGSLGGYTADAIKTLTGYGDYEVKQNVFSPGAPPHVRNQSVNSGGVIISHREYLGDIISSSSANTFKLQSFLINPGLEKSFPWLSQIAPNFQEYRMEGMIYEFRSMSADALNSTNTALGSVVMATNYNASDADYSSKSEMENSQYGQSIKPSESCIHYIECARSASVLSELYVRDDDINDNDDQRFFDLGKFQIATTGLQGTNVNLGELWVSYQVCLMKPILQDVLGSDIEFARFNNSYANSAPLNASGVVSNPQPGSNLACQIDSTGLILTIPQYATKKTYMIWFTWAGSTPVASTVSVAVVAGSNPLPVNIFENESVSVSGAPPAGTSTNRIERMICRSWEGYSNTPNTITFTAMTLPSLPIGVDILVMQVPNSIAQ